MGRRRVFVYLILDIAVWGIVAWLLMGDNDRARLVFWHHSKNGAWWAARNLGALGIFCESRYNRLVGIR